MTAQHSRTAHQGGSPPHSPVSGHRGGELAAILGSITAVGVTLGITAPLFSVLLDRMGLSALMVGLNGSVGVIATLLATPLIPRLLRRWGAVPLMLAGILLTAMALLAAGFLRSPSLWFGLRFLIGVGLSLHWVVSETWLNDATPDRHRGLVAGLYSALMGIGFAVGPLIVRGVGVDGLAAFVIGAALVIAAGLPLLFMRKVQTVATHPHDGEFMAVLRQAPVIMLASVASGFVESAMTSLLPVYGLRLHMSEARSVELLAVATLGAVLVQLPIGWIGDRLGRREALLGCAVVGAGTAALLPAWLSTPVLLWTDLFLWGGAVMSFYTLALALLGETFQGSRLASATSALVVTYALGSIAGPTVSGVAMDRLGPQGFVITMLATAALLAAASALRLRSRRF
ncbi:MAG TPA: MFS transporter [Gammaproteobacteria bacterium]|nr:MFS transporter [Gammaproteobacteria bacterium]